VNEAILLALSDEPFSSVRQMAGRPRDMRSKTLHKLHIVGLSILCISQSDIKHLHWVSDKPSDSQKASRVELLIQFREALSSIPHQG
jgi:hypothetical protein